MSPADPFPPVHAYALAHRCPTCNAQPGSGCDAPRKRARDASLDRAREQAGQEPFERDPLNRMHAARQDAGIRHRQRDIGNAPWAEDRVPGQRYDTMPDLS